MDAQSSPSPGDCPGGHGSGPSRVREPAARSSRPAHPAEGGHLRAPARRAHPRARVAAPGAGSPRARHLPSSSSGGRSRRPGRPPSSPTGSCSSTSLTSLSRCVSRQPQARPYGSCPASSGSGSSIRHTSFTPRLKRGGERLYTVRLERGTDARQQPARLAAGAGVLQRGAARRLGRATGSMPWPHRSWTWLGSRTSCCGRSTTSMPAQIMGAPTACGSADTTAPPRRWRWPTRASAGGTAATAHADIPAGRISQHLQLAGHGRGLLQSITNDGARDVDSGHGTHVSASVLGDGDAAGKGKGTAPGATSSSRRSRTTRPSPCSASSCTAITDGYYLVGNPDRRPHPPPAGLHRRRSGALQLLGQ